MPAKKKNKGGRPSEYSESYIQKADDYIEVCQDEEEQQLTGLSAKGTELYKQKLRVRIPTIEGFALFLGVNKTSLYEWEAKHPKFSNALDKVRVEQHNRLINNGLSGDYNPTIAKLMLSNNHGYREKTDVTSEGKALNLTFDNAFTPQAEGNS